LALAQAEAKEKGDLDTFNMASIMMTPAMWWNYPYHILNGTPEQLYPLPGTRTGQAIRELGGPLSVIGDVMAFPEEALRKKFNLSSFGEWGDYYIDRMLANLAAEGLYSTDEIMAAMLERKGEAYDFAYDRVQKEMAMKIPGSQTALAIQEKRLGAVMYTLPTTLFPAGLLPEGELIQRGLKYEHAKAWEAYENGDPNAINQFYEDYPEYQVRAALFKEPEERLQNFLVTEIWDRWETIDDRNKPLVVEQLGTGFEEKFLSKETRDYTAIDNETLAHWAKLLGGYIPETDETGAVVNRPIYQQDDLKLYTPEVLAQVEDFMTKRAELFPNYEFLNDTYWSLPEDPKDVRKDFLEEYPELKEGWDWKDEMYNIHPEVELYFEAQRKRYEESTLYSTQSEESPEEQMELAAQSYTQAMLPALKMQLVFTYYAGGDVEGAARTMLMDDWKNLGQPGASFEDWLSFVMKGTIR
jgi:hypothetical protein